MSRRSRAVRRPVPPDPRYDSQTVSKFVNALMYDGKKGLAEGVFYKAMDLIEERTVAPSLDKYLKVVTTEGGSVDKVDIWGRRRLAYDINKKSEAIYAVVQVTADPATVSEMDRLMTIDEKIVRTKVLRLEDSKK